MSDETYWGRIRYRLRSFCKPDDRLVCREVDQVPDSTCEMCLHHPITLRFHLENARTSAVLHVGRCCIVNYRPILVHLAKLDGLPTPAPVQFPREFAERVADLTQLCL